MAVTPIWICYWPDLHGRLWGGCVPGCVSDHSRWDILDPIFDWSRLMMRGLCEGCAASLGASCGHLLEKATYKLVLTPLLSGLVAITDQPGFDLLDFNSSQRRTSVLWSSRCGMILQRLIDELTRKCRKHEWRWGPVIELLRTTS